MGRKNVDGHMVAMQMTFYLLQRNSSKSLDVTAKQATTLQGVLENGMDLTVLQFVGECKGQSCSHTTKPIPMDDVPDD